jgi:hypothetical protein
MRCLYLNEIVYFAFVPSFQVEYKTSDKEIKTYCLKMKFVECPRYEAILKILKSTQLNYYLSIYFFMSSVASFIIAQSPMLINRNPINDKVKPFIIASSEVEAWLENCKMNHNAKTRIMPPKAKVMIPFIAVVLKRTPYLNYCKCLK